MNWQVFWLGFLSSGALVVAIGAQNAFVLRQTLRGEHVRALVGFGIAADAGLIAIGVLGVGGALQRRPELLVLARWGGAAFLVAYGVRALWRARSPAALTATRRGGTSLLRALVTMAALTFLNPHVYLDTVVLLGTLGASQPAGQGTFVVGAVAASTLWFVTLGVGGRLIATRLGDSRTWRVIDTAIGVTMLVLGATIAAGT
jgi:L-lysine exporter family protein LysE/ArgO